MNLAVLDNETIQEIKTSIDEKDIKKVEADLNEFFDNFLIEGQESLKQLEENPKFGDEEVPINYTQEQVKQIQYLFLCSFAIYHNVFSIMVYGKSLSKLVQEAIAGDDKSFLQAVKIDHNLIFDHPYFKERLAKANQNQELIFIQRVHEQQLAPSLSGRIKHRALYTMFYFLDMVKVLDKFSNRELFNLYHDSGVTEFETPPYELSSFSEHLKKYKKSR